MALFEFTNLNKYGNRRTRIIYNPTTQLSFNPKGLGSYVHIKLFKYEYTHSILPPALTTSNGKKYLIPTWKEIHPQTTLEDIKWIKPKIKTEPVFEKKTWNFESSSSDSVYKVTQVDSNTFKCNCPGFYRAKDRNLGCKHVQEVRESLTK
jgi:hypothetical protein